MSRRRQAKVREIKPDSRFNDYTAAKFINGLMYDGKKSISETIFYSAVEHFQEKINEGLAIDNFLQALNNIKPELEVRSRRVGGSTYQIPVEVRSSRRTTLAIRWIISAARQRSGKSMTEKLTAELLDAFNNRGNAFKKKEDTHRMAEANRAFAHYVW